MVRPLGTSAGCEHAIQEGWNYPLILRVFELRERLVDYQALSTILGSRSDDNRHRLKAIHL